MSTFLTAMTYLFFCLPLGMLSYFLNLGEQFIKVPNIASNLAFIPRFNVMVPWMFLIGQIMKTKIAILIEGR
jgi:hypothetical protein